MRDPVGGALGRGRLPAVVAAHLAAWDPYDQGQAAPFFDPKWMFELDDGFHIVIGNPPYLRVQGLQQTQPDFVPLYRERFQSAKGSFDIYALFVERGFQLLVIRASLPTSCPTSSFRPPSAPVCASCSPSGGPCGKWSVSAPNRYSTRPPPTPVCCSSPPSPRLPSTCWKCAAWRRATKSAGRPPPRGAPGRCPRPVIGPHGG